MTDEKRTRTRRRPALTVGWREWLALPELGIAAIKVKIDTGARSSSLHAEDIETYEAGGQQRVRFRVAPLREHSRFLLSCDWPVLDERSVKSSNGQEQQRLFIQTAIELGGERWPIELSLSNRTDMQFPMLLGREAMRGRVAVDPGRSWLCGREKPHYYRDHGLPRTRTPE